MKHAALRRSRVVAAAGALVLLGSLAACGGDDGDGGGDAAPADATQEEFCQAFADVFTGIVGAGDDEQAQIAAVKESVAELEEVGTPEDIPEDARRGFEVFVDLIGDLDEDMTAEDLESFGADISEDDNADAEAFTTWATQECPDAFSGMLGGGMPSDLPSELESEMGQPESTE